MGKVRFPFSHCKHISRVNDSVSLTFFSLGYKVKLFIVNFLHFDDIFFKNVQPVPNFVFDAIF
jgi:hypothetical protein